MGDTNKKNKLNLTNFSKGNPIIEISSKQNQIQTKNITPPSIPKETKKE